MNWRAVVTRWARQVRSSLSERARVKYCEATFDLPLALPVGVRLYEKPVTSVSIARHLAGESPTAAMGVLWEPSAIGIKVTDIFGLPDGRHRVTLRIEL